MNEHQENGIVYYLGKIEEQVKALIFRNESFNAENNLIAYRGEAQDYGNTKLTPSIFRNSEHLKNEKKLFEFLYDYEVLEGSVEKNIEKAIESQHYLAISRLLDITFNALSAFFFSCNYSKNENGYIYIFCFPEYFSPNSNYIEKYYSRALSNENIGTPYSKNFKVISHSHGNERMKAQDGGFIFFPGKEFKSISEIYYKKIEIDYRDKERIIRELSQIFNIHEAKIYPEKDKFSDYIKEKINRNYSEEKEINSNNELESCMTRLYFEIDVMVKSGLYNSNQILRIVRKEESDMIRYLETNSEDKEIKKENISECNKLFKTLKKMI